MKNQAVPFVHPKERGEWVEMRFMARAAEHGLHITKPWGDSRPYDFAVEYQGRFLRVQVKSTSRKRGNYYVCTARSGNKPYRHDEIDFIAMYVIPEDVWYIIPIHVIPRSSTALILSPSKMNSKYAAYKEAWHLLRGE